MAIDSALKRRKALSSFLGWGASVLPSPDGSVDDTDKEQVLKKYTTFNKILVAGRHELAMRRLFPIKELIQDE